MQRLFELAANAELLFQQFPMVDRIAKLDERGLKVEIWNLLDHDVDAISRRGVSVASMTGHLSGNIYTDAGRQEYLNGARRILALAHQVDCSRLVLHAGEVSSTGKVVRPWFGPPTGRMWLNARATLEELAMVAEKHEVTYLFENLNVQKDHTGAAFSSSQEVLALVRDVDSPRLQVLLDLYHAQIDEGNLSGAIEQASPWLGEIQVADVPARGEPGTGEINYPYIAQLLRDMKFAGTVCLEAIPASDEWVALEGFLDVFG